MINEYKYEDLVVKTYEFKSGLKLTWILNENIDKYLVELIVNLGAKHSRLKVDKKEIKIIPGTAHFLEHMMFSDKTKDLFETFYNNNIDINAQTNINTTNYFFQTTNLNLTVLSDLFKLVKIRNFDGKVMRKEKHIVLQEIISYDTDSDEIFGANFKQALFKDSIYAYDILGTKESVNSFDLDYLALIFKHTYTLNNMHLVIQSRELPTELINYLSNLEDNFTAKPLLITEPLKVNSQKLINEVTNYDETLRLIYVNLITDTLSYQEHLLFNLYRYLLYDVDSYLFKKINNNKKHHLFFQVGYDYYTNFSYLYFNGETTKDKRLIKLINNHLKRFKVSFEQFVKAKKLFYYKYLESLLNPNYIQSLSVLLIAYNLNYLDLFKIYEQLNYEDFTKLIKKYHLKHEFLYLSN